MANEPDFLPPGEDRRNWTAWGILLAVLVAFGAGMLIYPEFADHAPTRNRDSGASSSGTAPIGTSGRERIPGAEDNSGPSARPSVIRELETIVGMNDGHELIGRKVHLDIPVAQHINDVAFWIGAGDNRLLVVLARDNRDGADRQRGRPSSTNLQAHTGERVTVTGTVQGLPHAEAMHSWGLTNRDREELRQRKIYIRAE
jgi:hypothetical protein